MIRKFGWMTAIAMMAVVAAGDLSAAEKKYGPGVTDTEIKLGQTVPYSGPASAFSSYGRVMTGYFKMINEAGGINGRKINLISLDNAFSPPKAIEQTRKLVEDDGVLADVGTVGTTPNVAIQKYLNGAKVPHIFVSAGGRRFADPQNFPWTVPMYPGFEMEGKTFGQYILKHRPAARVGVLYQNDDYGKDFLAGLKAALGDKVKIVAEVAYEITEPTIDSQIVRLKDSGADTLLYFSTPKFTAQGLRKVKETGWTPLQFLASPTNSVKTVLEPAGFENAQGIITTQFTKQAGDPAWASDPRSDGVCGVYEEVGAERQSRRFRRFVRLRQRTRYRPGDHEVRRRSDAGKSAEAGDQHEGHAFQDDAAGRSAQHHAAGLCTL
jgi:branched-chain amino acid transport system substrate-binding protein